jgi:hypothetical protein
MPFYTPEMLNLNKKVMSFSLAFPHKHRERQSCLETTRRWNPTLHNKLCLGLDPVPEQDEDKNCLNEYNPLQSCLNLPSPAEGVKIFLWQCKLLKGSYLPARLRKISHASGMDGF